MHKKNIRKIIETGTPSQMQKLEEVFVDAVCRLDKEDYIDIEMDLHKILYGEHLGEDLAKCWVSNMDNKDGTHGAHWSDEQVESVRKQHADSCDKWDFYAALHMMYSDYYQPKFDTDVYAAMAKDWLTDKDVGDGKTLKYYMHVVHG